MFSQIWKQYRAEVEAFGSRYFKLETIDGLLESRKFEKVKGSNIVKCVQKKYFSYIIDKIVSLTYKKLFKNFGYPVRFLLLFLLLFLLIVYISLAFHLERFQSDLFRISIV